MKKKLSFHNTLVPYSSIKLSKFKILFWILHAFFPHCPDFLITSCSQGILHSWMGDVQYIVLYGLSMIPRGINFCKKKTALVNYEIPKKEISEWLRTLFGGLYTFHISYEFCVLLMPWKINLEVFWLFARMPTLAQNAVKCKKWKRGR